MALKHAQIIKTVQHWKTYKIAENAHKYTYATNWEDSINTQYVTTVQSYATPDS